MLNRFRGCLLGLACGDAVGTTVEFKPRGTFTPITDMVGGGPFRLKIGEWTDDTSMSLCLAVSLLESNGFDPQDQIERYCRWWAEGYLSSNGTCFDIGNTVKNALHNYRMTHDPYSGSTNPQTAGNGSIMRLAPVPMYYVEDLEKVIHFSGESSRTTHGAQESVDACRLFGMMIALALRGESKENILFNHHNVKPPNLQLAPSIQNIADGNYRSKQAKDIRGSGYVVASLEAALWCFLNSENYREAILLATNLGDDADTTAAICGQISGAYYGVENIPEGWLTKLVMRTYIEGLAEQLYNQRYHP